MAMFTLIAYAIIVLTLAVIVLSAFIVLARYLSDLRQVRFRRLSTRMQRRLNEYLDGLADAPAVIQELGHDPNIALGVLIGAASRLPRDARMPLRELFGHFQFPQKWITALKARRWAVRVHAATQLGYMCDDSAVPGLTEALEDEMLDVRLAAAHALVQLGAIGAVRPILRSLALPAAWPSQRAAEILYGFGAEAVDPLLGFLRDQGPQSQDTSVTVAVRVLGMLRARRAAPQVSEFLRSPDPELRLSSAKALGEMGDPQAAQALRASLDDPVWEVRSAAARALGRLGDQAVIPSLAKTLADAAWWARFNAAESLFQLGPAGQGALKSAMATHTDAFARDISRQILEEHGVIPVQEALPT